VWRGRARAGPPGGGGGGRGGGGGCAARPPPPLPGARGGGGGGWGGLIVTDTHGRAFRRGLVNVAIGVAGFEPVVDHRGGHDRAGQILVATDQALADELAAAAGIHMGKGSGTPAVVVSGVATLPAPGGAGALLRDPAHDLFRT